MSTYSLLIAQLLVVVYCCRRLLIRVRLDRLALAGLGHYESRQWKVFWKDSPELRPMRGPP